MDIFNLNGKVALVTGGSKGLGKAMARGLAEAGADIVISSRHENELKPALEEILRGTDRKGRFIVADMSRRSDVLRLARTALEQMGRVDILVNNAGTNIPQAIDQIKDEDWDAVMEINLNSIMVLTRALVPQMKTRGWGRVIHISSVMGFISKEGRNAYSATKSALIGLARANALDLGRYAAGPAAVQRGKTGIYARHRFGPMGGAEGAGRPGVAVGQRRRRVHHRRNPRGGRRLAGPMTAFALHEMPLRARL